MTFSPVATARAAQTSGFASTAGEIFPSEEAFDNPADCTRLLRGFAHHYVHAMHLPVLPRVQGETRLGGETNGGYAIDSFDALRPHYLLLRGFDVSVYGSCAPALHRSDNASPLPALLGGRLSIRAYSPLRA